MTFLYLMMWVLFVVALSLIMALYLELVWACPQFATSNSTFDQCMRYSYMNSKNLRIMITLSMSMVEINVGFCGKVLAVCLVLSVLTLIDAA